ncbi:MAG: restriction endonuclease subunit S [Maribacter arcticus]|uniref:restriction endonuclease subunit S n=1 Tax=Maribacter arcticus TaxID=561365 RepID=UPI0030032AC6
MIVKLALQGRLTKNWRDNNEVPHSGLHLLNKLKINYEKKFDKLNKRDAETKAEVLELFSKFDIPKNWAICALHDLANFWNGKAHEKGVQEDGDYFLVNSRFVSTNGIRFKRTNLALSPLKVNDIAIVMSDVPDGRALARCFHVKEANKYTLNQRIGGITLFDGINPEFMVLALDRNQHYLDVNDGKKQSNLKRIQMISCPIALPPLEEQKEIVKVVESLFKEVEQLEQLTVARIGLKEDFVSSALQQLTTNNANQEWTNIQDHFKSFFNETANIKKLRETVLQLAVQGKLTADWRATQPNTEDAIQLLNCIQEEKAQLIKDKKIKREKALPVITDDEIPYELPVGWVWCRMGDIAEKLGAGSTPSGGKNAYVDDGIMFFRSQNVRNYYLKLQQVAFITDEIHEKMKGTKVQPQDLLLNITGGSIGRCALVPDDFDTANVSQHVAIIRLIDLAMRKYMHSLILSKQFQDTIMDVQVGVSREGLSMTKLKLFLVPLPPLEEQKAIVHKVNALMGLCDVLEQEVQQSQENSEQLMKSCLREVFEGEKEVII